MTAPGRKRGNPAGTDSVFAELEELRAGLRESEEALAAIRAGGVDAIVVSGEGREHVFTLAGIDSAYRVFVEAMENGAVTVSASGTILYANKAFARLLDRPLEELIGSSIFKLLNVSERDVFDAVFREALHRGGGRCELALSRNGEDQIPVFVSATSVGSSTRALCMVITDLSLQKRNEQIVANGRLALLIMNHATEPMAVCDSAGTVLHCNRAFQELCGANPLLRHFDDAIRLEIVEEHSPEQTDAARPVFRAPDALNGQEFRGTEVCFRSAAREPIHLLLSTGPLVLPNMERVGLLITLFNIEERRRTEHALRRSEKLAATGRLAASIAHEINNPLAALTNLIYLIQMEPSTPVISRYAQMAQEELGRVAHITRQTLAFYRESSAPGEVNLTDLIDSALFLYASAIRVKSISVIREIRFDGKLHGFSNELRQVLSNLIANAVEAMPAGGRLRIRVYSSRKWKTPHTPGVRIVIGDTGQGIGPEHRSRLFEPFFTTKAEKGTGLGLWVSQGIVERHGGFIQVRSSICPELSGTVFRIFLPAEGMGVRPVAA